jgi:hypothetical protein
MALAKTVLNVPAAANPAMLRTTIMETARIMKIDLIPAFMENVITAVSAGPRELYYGETTFFKFLAAVDAWKLGHPGMNLSKMKTRSNVVSFLWRGENVQDYDLGQYLSNIRAYSSFKSQRGYMLQMGLIISPHVVKKGNRLEGTGFQKFKLGMEEWMRQNPNLDLGMLPCQSKNWISIVWEGKTLMFDLGRALHNIRTQKLLKRKTYLTDEERDYLQNMGVIIEVGIVNRKPEAFPKFMTALDAWLLENPDRDLNEIKKRTRIDIVWKGAIVNYSLGAAIGTIRSKTSPSFRDHHDELRQMGLNIPIYTDSTSTPTTSRKRASAQVPAAPAQKRPQNLLQVVARDAPVHTILSLDEDGDDPNGKEDEDEHEDMFQRRLSISEDEQVCCLWIVRPYRIVSAPFPIALCVVCSVVRNCLAR